MIDVNLLIIVAIILIVGLVSGLLWLVLKGFWLIARILLFGARIVVGLVVWAFQRGKGV
jgi:hypothetical protein